MALKKFSPVSDEINHAVLDTLETGLVHYWYHENRHREGTGDATSFVSHRKLPSQSMPIHVKHFVMPILLCCISFIIALVVLLKERFSAEA